MKRTWLAVSLLCPASWASAGGAQATAPPVAIAYALTGEVSVVGPGERRAIQPGAWLEEGARLEAGPKSSVVVAFAGGIRHELRGGARVTLGRSDLASSSGDVKALPPLPILAELLAPRDDERVGARAGAIRLREKAIRGLSPHGATCLADAIVLRFDPAPGVARYEVEVRDDAGRSVFRTDTGSTSVAVPAGRLEPGRRHSWRVRAMTPAGWLLEGEARFTTLSARAASARQTLWDALEGSREPSDAALLAAVDHALRLDVGIPDTPRLADGREK